MAIVHEKQKLAFNDPSRFKYLLVGRRGGKTKLITEAICRAVQQAPLGAKIFYIGPTLQQAYELIWDALRDRFDELLWKYEDKKSERRFEFKGGISVYVIGGEKIRRIRGHKVFFLCIDELAFFETDLNEVWRACRPTLTDLKGSAIVATTPNGKGTQAYDFYLEALKKTEWAIHSWVTLENPFIDPLEIEAAKHELDERSFRQEYLAEWESFDGLAYYNFNEKIHIVRQEINLDSPLYLCFDFNVNPTTLILRQSKIDRHLEKLCYAKEYSIKNSSTIDTLRNFCEDYKVFKDRVRLKIRGDSTGDNRKSSTGRSDYYYVKEILSDYGFNYEYEVPSKNPPIIDRVQHVNNYLRNVKGEHRIEVDPTCVELIRDLSSQVLEGRFPSDKNNLGHRADAIGYDVHMDYLMKHRGNTTTIQL